MLGWYTTNNLDEQVANLLSVCNKNEKQLTGGSFGVFVKAQGHSAGAMVSLHVYYRSNVCQLVSIRHIFEAVKCCYSAPELLRHHRSKHPDVTFFLVSCYLNNLKHIPNYQSILLNFFTNISTLFSRSITHTHTHTLMVSSSLMRAIILMHISSILSKSGRDMQMSRKILMTRLRTLTPVSCMQQQCNQHKILVVHGNCAAFQIYTFLTQDN